MHTERSINTAEMRGERVRPMRGAKLLDAEVRQRGERMAAAAVVHRRGVSEGDEQLLRA